MIGAFVSHKTDNWSTPVELYNLFKAHGFYDPCPLDPNGFDAFFKEWGDKNFVNPPYSDINRFVDKAICEHSFKKEVWLLVPSRTGSKWFSKLYKYGCHFIFIQGRLRFGGSGCNAPFDSCLVKLTGHGSFMSVVSRNLILDYLTDYSFCPYWQGGF